MRGRTIVRRVVAVALSLAVVACGHTEPGKVKAGALMSLRETSVQGDVALVEIAGLSLREDAGEIASVNFGGSIAAEALTIALLTDLDVLTTHLTGLLGVSLAALPVEIGIYGSYRFDTNGEGGNGYDLGVCCTLIRVSF